MAKLASTFLEMRRTMLRSSMVLPAALMELQKERIEHEISERRKKEGINDNEDLE